jgi:transposase
MPRAAASSLPLTEREREELLQFSKLRSTPQSIALRIQIVLRAAEGIANKVLARQLSTTLPTVLLWRRRYQNEGLAGMLEDRPRSGRPREISAEQEAVIVETTLHSTPKDATHWSVRSMAKTHPVSPASVQRIWKKQHLQPHRVEKFKFSTDPQFVSKVRDLVGLYLNPPSTLLCSVWMRRVRSKPWIALSPFFLSGRACRSDRLTTMNGTVPRPCSPPSTWLQARSSLNANGGIATRSSCVS